MQLTFNANSKPSRPEGLRAGVTGSEIADTIDSVLAYFEKTKQNFPTLLDAIRKEATGWQGSVAALRGADQAKIDGFFGQQAPKDVSKALADMGVSPKKYGEPGYEAYSKQYSAMWEKMQTKGGSYVPGSPTSSLDDYRSILAFDAYREKLDNLTDGPAGKLVARIDAFEGNRGSKHLAITHLMHEIYAYIGNTPRHPSEAYVEPDDVKVDYLNAFHHTYSTYMDWKPTDDMQQVVARISHGTGEVPETKYSFLAHEKAKNQAALVERGGIRADVKVELGKTYAEDAVVITMSMEDYMKRYLPILRGDLEIDTSVPGGNWDGSISHAKVYRGYEPGKKSFYWGDNLLVSAAHISAIEAEFPQKRLQGASEALSFLRNTNSLAETAEKVTVAPGQKEDFVRLTPVFKMGAQKVYEFEDTYYSDCDLHNQINRSLSEIDAAVNGRKTEPEPVRKQEKPDTVVFEHNGDTYLPRGDKYYQIALHMQHKYGIDYTWVFRDKEAEKIADGKDKYVISTSQLDPAVRDAALADMQTRLDTEWQAKDLRAATVLRHKIRVSKPLALKAQP